MIVLGIDPGVGGGLAVIITQVDIFKLKPPEILGGIRTPLTSHRGKKIVDSSKLFQWLSNFEIDVAVVEQVSGRPGQAGVFQFGRATGAVEAVAMIVSPRMSWVTPAVWKSYFGLSKDKQQSIDTARHRFGNSYHWKHKADDGIAEAALMAQWYLDVKT